MKLLSLFAVVTEALVGRFLHITDIHYDPNYKTGSPVNCLLGKIDLGCCRSYNIPIEPYEKASKWGNYKCDTPYLFVNETLEWIRRYIGRVDFVIYTGDTVGHHDITQSIKHNIKSINDINDLFKHYFDGVKTYSSIGNHDTYPIDQTQKNINFMFLQNFATNWAYWLNSSETISHGGYYSTKIGTNMYIINLNSLLYDNINIFHLIQGEEQWEWFEGMLKQIRDEGASLWIINHICPFSHEARSSYTSRFVSIISQYTDIIKYQFYGHVHSDTFTLLSNNGVVVGFCAVPSSLMMDKHEASFRIYSYDRNTYDILDYDQYVSNIAETIRTDTMVYYKSYSFNSEYNLNGVNMDNWIQLYQDISNNDTILQRYYHNLKPGLNGTDRCDSECKQSILSDIYPSS